MHRGTVRRFTKFALPCYTRRPYFRYLGVSRAGVLACLTGVPIFNSCPDAGRHYEDRRNERSRVANKSMEFIDKEMLDRIVRGLQEDLSVLQIKVGALENLLLKNDEIRATYTRLVSEEAERLIRQRKSTL